MFINSIFNLLVRRVLRNQRHNVISTKRIQLARYILINNHNKVSTLLFDFTARTHGEEDSLDLRFHLGTISSFHTASYYNGTIYKL